MSRWSVMMGIALVACGPHEGDEEELRCSTADVELAPASGPAARPCFAVTDEGVDGSIDRYETWVYHALGEPLWIELGEGDVPKVRFHFGHDAQGRLIWRTQEDASTGLVTSRWDREYSEGVMLETHADATGAVTSVSRVELDARGDSRLSLSDNDLDGRVDWRTTNDRDADGRLLESRFEQMLDDWTPWYTYTYEHDDDGFLVETHYDYHRPSDTQHDTVTHHTNDEWGNELVAEFIDLVDREHSCTYDSYVCDG